MRYLSQVVFIALKLSGLINTRTPERVVAGRADLQAYLRLGEVVQCCINGLSRQRRRLVQA